MSFLSIGPARPATGVALAAALMALAGTGSIATASTARPTGIGAGAEATRRACSSYELRNADGGRFTLSSLRGQVVVVSVWASWCQPCRKELPSLAALHREIQGHGGRVVAVSVDTELRNAQRFAKAHAAGLPIVHDGPDGLARQLDLQALPFTMVLDRNGAIALAVAGGDRAALDRVAATTRQLIAGGPAPIAGDTP
jgi:peroxiredoxin